MLIPRSFFTDKGDLYSRSSIPDVVLTLSCVVRLGDADASRAHLAPRVELLAGYQDSRLVGYRADATQMIRVDVNGGASRRTRVKT